MSEGRSLDQWLSIAGGVVAPLGAVSALLFYFGYAATRAKYAYFGIDVDAVGLETRDYLLLSTQPLLVPVLVLAVIALGGVWLQMAIRTAVEFRPEHLDRGSPRPKAVRVVTVAIEALGTVMLAIGVTLCLTFAWLGGWSAYGMVTPLCLTFGILLATYGRHVRAIATSQGGNPATRPASLRRRAWSLSAIVVAGCVFWASSTLAEWSGRGQAVDLSSHFDDLPRVILDTHERLYIQNEIIQESVLPPEQGQTFRYRYRNLRLLVEGEQRMFLVPERWSNNGTTLVVPLDTHVRVQFQFQNPG